MGLEPSSINDEAELSKDAGLGVGASEMVSVVIDEAEEAIVEVSLNEEAAEDAGDAINLPKDSSESVFEGGVIGRGDSLGGLGRIVAVVAVRSIGFSDSTIWVGESGVMVSEVIRFGDLEDLNLWPSPVKPIFVSWYFLEVAF